MFRVTWLAIVAMGAVLRMGVTRGSFSLDFFFHVGIVKNLFAFTSSIVQKTSRSCER